MTPAVPPDAVSWWRDAVVYQVYIRSFMDSDGDGVGDMDGIRTRLPYLADLGVDVVWITPFYKSPMADHGYDVADYRDIDPLFGDLAGFDAMLAAAHGLGLRVIVDIVPNHTSDHHAWFQEAIGDPASPMRDRYIFRPRKPGGGPPNNWGSVFGGPAWTQEPGGGEYYLHLFTPEQPDLNWRNPDVQDDFRGVLRFWLDRGVDGFRIDVAHGLYKDADLRDNPLKEGPTLTAGTQYQSLESKHNWDQPETVDVYRDWRSLLDAYTPERMLVGEVFLYDQKKVARYVGPDRLHQAFNFSFAGTRFNAAHLFWEIANGIRQMTAAGAPCTWVLSNHDLPRHATRFGGGSRGRARGRAVTLMLLALPGSPYMYQGEELGAEQVDVLPDDRQDPIFFRSERALVGRDGCRTPIPWSAESPSRGFTTGKPWLPLAPDSATRNVATSLARPGSQLNWYRAALALRRQLLGAAAGELAWVTTQRQLLAFRRGTGEGSVLCVLNTGRRAATLVVPESRILFASKPGAKVASGALTLPPESCVWVQP